MKKYLVTFMEDGEVLNMILANVETVISLLRFLENNTENMSLIRIEMVTNFRFYNELNKEQKLKPEDLEYGVFDFNETEEF